MVIAPHQSDSKGNSLCPLSCELQSLSFILGSSCLYSCPAELSNSCDSVIVTPCLCNAYGHFDFWIIRPNTRHKPPPRNLFQSSIRTTEVAVTDDRCSKQGPYGLILYLPHHDLRGITFEATANYPDRITSIFQSSTHASCVRTHGNISSYRLSLGISRTLLQNRYRSMVQSSRSVLQDRRSTMSRGRAFVGQ